MIAPDRTPLGPGSLAVILLFLVWVTLAVLGSHEDAAHPDAHPVHIDQEAPR